MSDHAPQQLLHLVIGGELADLEHNTFKDLDQVDIVGVYPNYATAYAAWRECSGRLQSLESDEQERLRMADLWRFQAREIESAGLRDGEDGQLETEKRLLNNAEKLYTAAMSAYEQLYEGSNAAEASLRAAQRHLEELARYEPRFGDGGKIGRAAPAPAFPPP